VNLVGNLFGALVSLVTVLTLDRFKEKGIGKIMEIAKLSPNYLQKWFNFLIREAQLSPDPSTQNAALIVNGMVDGEPLTAGYGHNDFPKGVQPRLDRPAKYTFIEHAERNAIYDAALEGEATLDATMVALWAACADCARAIIQSGIKTLYRHSFYTSHGHGDDSLDRMPWKASTDAGDQMLREAGVDIIEYDLYSGGAVVLFNGSPVILGEKS
jgi:dCMP deaminase